MAAQELCWLTYLLTDLGEAPRSPPVLYQRGQLRLACVASQANTVDVFTKALQPCDQKRFLLVVDDYSRNTTVFHLRSKGDVTEVLIEWIRGARRQLSESFGSDLPVLRLHSDRGGEFPSNLLKAFCRAEGISQTFTL
ncbi:unnamed protein product [Closterium sp. NIES-53]